MVESNFFLRLCSLLGLFLFVPISLNAQYKLNFGLREKQSPAELPRSRVPTVQPVARSKTPPHTVLQNTQPGEWIITGGWQLCDGNGVLASSQSLFDADFNSSHWYNATVPGTVLTTLVDQGVYPDPYYGLNNLSIPDSLCRTDWWYRAVFDLPEKNSGHVWLLFNGINYRADIWLNGRLVGKMTGAFIRGEFEISEAVKRIGDNVLAVHIFPPPNPGIPHEESARSGPGPNGGQLCLDGPTFISSEGWDWVPGIRDRNIGLWQDVRLRVSGDIKIVDPHIITDLPLPDTSSAMVTIRLQLKNLADRRVKGLLQGKIEDRLFNQDIALDAGQQKTVEFSPTSFKALQFSHPRLWWPNSYGRPELYHLELSVQDENATSDRQTVRFGMREFSYELSIDTPEKQIRRVEFDPIHALKQGLPLFDNIHRRDVGDGVVVPKLRDGIAPDLLVPVADAGAAPYLVIKVNGVPVFCRGGNWGMDDAMKRVSRERLEPNFRLHREAGFNMIRNWTGESTEELFYDLADEYGLLVWNDFWLSTEGYNLEVNDNRLFLDNASDVVKRFRNHPSIAIWCPRNEGYAPPALEEPLALLIAQQDGTRHYQPNSRYLNLRPSGPWHYFTDSADYFRKNAHGFNTEQGTPSVPTAATMKKMMAPEDLWPISDSWHYHDLHDGQKDYLNAIDSLYGTAKDVEEFCRKAQMVNYDSHRAMFEAWNSRMWNNTTGLLLWMTHPAWPSTVWQVYSWDYETFGAYFGCKKACEPAHVQMNLHDNQVLVINTTQSTMTGAQVRLSYYDLTGRRFYKKEIKTSIAPNSVTRCFLPDALTGLPEVYLARVELSNKKHGIVSINDYWKTNYDAGDFKAFNDLDKVIPAIKAFRKIKTEKAYQGVFELVNPADVIAVGIKLNLLDRTTGEIILPAYFSEGYFNLLPGESRTVMVEAPFHFSGKEQVMISGYNVPGQPAP